MTNSPMVHPGLQTTQVVRFVCGFQPSTSVLGPSELENLSVVVGILRELKLKVYEYN